MKLKYQISNEAKLEPIALMNKICSQLIEQDYIIMDRTENTISFKDDNWQIRPKNKIFSKVDEGKFEIKISGEYTLIKFTYYISFLPELIIIAIILIVGISQSYLILFIALPFLIQLSIRISTLKKVCDEMIMKIVD